MNKKIAFVSDFDGTITKDDFFNYVVDAYLDDTALSPWQEYRTGKKTQFDALNEIFGKIRVKETELDNLISQIYIDPHVNSVWDLCQDRNIPMYICSAGNDYYIKKLIGEDIKNYNIKLITNTATYSKEDGMQMEPLPLSSPFYDKDVGISKSKIIEKLKSDGYFVIFAGDGPPDVAPAMLSDVVFARKYLLSECQKLSKATQNFDSYKNIYNYIKDM